MKKFLLIIGMLISANMIFAQTATMQIGDVDITSVPIGGTVVVPILVPEINDGTIYTMQFFVGFDHAMFTWKGSFANPLTGIQNFHPNFPYGTTAGAWFFNDNGTELVTLWDDASNFHTMPSPGYWYEMLFTYNGGLLPGQSSGFVWGTSGKDEGGKLVKGTTEVYDQNFNQYVLTLVNGSAFIPMAGLPPVADFMADNTLPNVGATVTFTDMSINVPTSWAWSFSGPVTYVGGTSSSSQNPMVTFDAAGCYDVTLFATNADGSDGETKLCYIDAQPVGPVVNTWQGDVPGDETNWFNPGNWSLNVVPTNEDVLIPGGKPIGVIIELGDATTGNLTVDAGAGIQINPTGSLRTYGLYNNNGELLITSDATGAAGAFIDDGGLISSLNLGTYEFDRFLVPAPNGSPFGWHFISSPVNSSVTADLVGYWVKEWFPNLNSYVDSDPWGNFNGIVCDDEDYSLGNVLMNVMSGYSVKRDVDYLIHVGAPYTCPQGIVPETGDMVEFGGDVLDGLGPWGEFQANATTPALMANVNTGIRNTNVRWNGVPGSPVLGPFHDFNLIGNPYSAPIDNATFVPRFPVEVNGTIWYWDNAALNYKFWAGGLGAPQVPATQGFFVQVNTPGVWNISLLPADRTVVGAGIFYKETINDVLKLQASGNGLSDELYIRFTDDANTGFDSQLDAHKMFSTAEGVPQIYTQAGSELLSINALPVTEIVPMGFTSATSGIYIIEAVETSEFTDVVLEDLANGIQTDLLSGSYSFEYTTGAEHGFIIHFTPLGTPELAANSINIWANDRNIYVQAPATTGDIVVYNMIGQEIVRTGIEAGLNVIPMTDVNTYYIVKVIGSEITETGKVFIR